MSTLKNLTVLLFLIVTSALTAQPRISINESLLMEATNAIKQKFNSQAPITSSEIFGFLDAQYSGASINPSIAAPAAKVVFLNPSLVDFEWPVVPSSTDYSVKWLNLHTGQSGGGPTPTNSYSASGLAQDLYLFTFYTNSPSGQSNIDFIVLDLNLGYIIIDKDIFLLTDPSCPSTQQVQPVLNRKLQASFRVDWNAACNNVGRYYITTTRLNTNGTIESSEYRVEYTQNTLTQGADNIFFEPVTDPIDYSNPYLAGKEGAYEFTLTSTGAEIFFPAENLLEGQVHVLECSCPIEKRNADAEEQTKAANQSLLLAQPNPFRESAQIEYELAEASEVSIYLFNSLQQKQVVLQNRTFRSAGTHQFRVDGSRLPAGMYTCIVKTSNQLQHVKLIKVD